MMGAVLPIYAGDQHRDCAVIYMVNEDNRIRQMEAMQGLWEMGVKREPIVRSFSFQSMNRALKNDKQGVFRQDDLAAVVKLLRQLRPLVVVTHDVNGEYGHPEHIKTSAIVRRAVELAADPAYDTDSVKEYGTWQVQKEYIHMWQENPLLLDINVPLENMDGRTAMQIAKAAFAYHKTQQKWSVAVQNRKNPIGQFGLYFTTVGLDSGINDMMENVVPPTPPLP
jgi:LmbE family N-acetylglucosaminyl deacetylase